MGDTPSNPNVQPNSLGNLADEEPKRKNHMKEKLEIAEKLLKLHNEWIIRAACKTSHAAPKMQTLISYKKAL
jgi:hypothetical protein